MNYEDIILKSTKKTIKDLGQQVGEGGEDTTGMTPIHYTDVAIVKYMKPLVISGQIISELKDNIKFIMLREIPINSYIGYKSAWYKVISVDNTIPNIYTMYTEYCTLASEVVYSLEINNNSPIELNVNNKCTLSCTCKCNDKIDNNPKLNYAVDNDNCTVDSNGVIHGVKGGSSVVSVTYNGIIKTIDVNIHDVYSIECDNVNALDTSSSIQLKPTLKKNGNVITEKLTYKSNNISITTVSDLGLVTVVGVGATTIDISYGNYVTKTINVTIAKNDIYTIECSDITVDKGNTVQLAPICKKNGIQIDNQPINYSVADSSIANISSDGIVTALSVGNTTITMTWQGVSTTINVTVNKSEPITYTINGKDKVVHKNTYSYTLSPSNSNCVWSLDEFSEELEIARIESQSSDKVTIYAYETLSSDICTLYAKEGDTILAQKEIIIKRNL